MAGGKETKVISSHKHSGGHKKGSKRGGKKRGTKK